jgi:hypothetical protein
MARKGRPPLWTGAARKRVLDLYAQDWAPRDIAEHFGVNERRLGFLYKSCARDVLLARRLRRERREAKVLGPRAASYLSKIGAQLGGATLHKVVPCLTPSQAFRLAHEVADHASPQEFLTWLVLQHLSEDTQ